MKILLDSGAYSAWTQGNSLDLGEYVAYVKHNREFIHRFVNLDVIPGSHAQREWRSKLIEDAAAQSYKNQQRMKVAGLDPIPVFHMGEGWKWLERYPADGEDYIALAAYLKAGRGDIIGWFDRCFELLTDTNVKVHGLGVTSNLLLQRYRWQSVDSATWLRQSMVGQIPVPVYIDGNANYSLGPSIVSVTDRSSERSNHIDKLDDLDLDRVHQFLNDEVGIELVHARYSVAHRWRAWITYLEGLQAKCSARLFYVTDTTPQQREVLTSCDVQHRLLSYYKLKDAPRDTLERYVEGRLRTTPKSRNRDWSSESFWNLQRLHVYERARRLHP